MQKPDLRVIKTQKNIRASFVRLLEEKSFSAITIQNILDEALINRTTFYRHYDSKYTLVEEMNASIMERFEALLSASLQDRDRPERLFQSIEQLAKEFRKDRATVLALWKVREEGIDLFADMEQLMRSKFRSFLSEHASEEDNLDYQTSVMTAMILTTFRYLLESTDTYSIRELATQMVNLIRRHALM